MAIWRAYVAVEPWCGRTPTSKLSSSVVLKVRLGCQTQLGKEFYDRDNASNREKYPNRYFSQVLCRIHKSWKGCNSIKPNGLAAPGFMSQVTAASWFSTWSYLVVIYFCWADFLEATSSRGGLSPEHGKNSSRRQRIISIYIFRESGQRSTLFDVGVSEQNFSLSLSLSSNGVPFPTSSKRDIRSPPRENVDPKQSVANASKHQISCGSGCIIWAAAGVWLLLSGLISQRIRTRSLALLFPVAIMFSQLTAFIACVPFVESAVFGFNRHTVQQALLVLATNRSDAGHDSQLNLRRLVKNGVFCLFKRWKVIRRSLACRQSYRL